jgi:hypothetical protein
MMGRNNANMHAQIPGYHDSFSLFRITSQLQKMAHELPPHFNKIKTDEDRFFAEKSQREDSLDLRLRVTKLESELKFAAIQIAELRHHIRQTIMENLHLSDGDDCTLKGLKDAISYEFEDSCENA